MAKCLLRAGLDIAVHDSKVAALTVPPFKMLREPNFSQQQVVFLYLPNSEAVESFLHSHLSHLPRGSIVVDTSTTTPETAVLCASTLEMQDVHFLDSPVTGEEARAREGTLTFIASGRKAVFDCVAPLLGYMGSRLVFMGEENGKAQLAKALNNALYNISVAATAEVLTVARESGLSAEAFVEAVSSGSGSSFGFQKVAPLCLAGQFRAPEHGYALGKAAKDMEVARAAQAALTRNGAQLRLPVLEGCAETYEQALQMGLGDQAKGAMIKVYGRNLDELRY